jgi:hypothetical protein
MSLISKAKYVMGMSNTPLDGNELKGIQEEINRVKNECVDNINMQLNPTLTPRPGSVIYSDNITTVTITSGPYTLPPSSGNIVSWAKPSKYKEASKLDIEQADLINTKKFKMIAEKFCALNPNWSVVPDINEPLRKIRIMHNSNQLWIQDCFPSNEIRVVGGSVQKVFNHCDPLAQINLEFPVHSMYVFEKWAFGLEDCPYGK